VPAEDDDAAERDFTALWRAALPIARDMLQRERRLYPFAVAVALDGGLDSVGADLPVRRRRMSSPRQMLLVVEQALAAKADDLRAFALVTDFDVEGGPALVVQLEHRDGTALMARVPFTKPSKTRPVRFGELEPHPGRPQLWTGESS
jgi:hypothetical protein